MTRRSDNRLPRVLFAMGRVLSGVAVIWFGFCLVAWYATQGWGFDASTVINDFLVALILPGPLAFLPFAGCRARTRFVGALLLFLAAFLPGEIFARAQEYQALRTYGPHPDREVLISRWAPYDYHTIAYYPDRGWTGWD